MNNMKNVELEDIEDIKYFDKLLGRAIERNNHHYIDLYKKRIKLLKQCYYIARKER